MDEQARLAVQEHDELAAWLEGPPAEMDSPGTRDAHRRRRLSAYLSALRSDTPEGAAPASSEAEEARELVDAWLDRLPVDPSMMALLSVRYGSLGATACEVASLAIELCGAPSARRRDVQRRLSELRAAREGGFRELVQTQQDEGRKVDLLLRLHEGGVDAEAIDEFVSLADETMAALPPEARGRIRELKRARAQALASDPADQGQAAQAYRELLDTFAREDDFRDFEAFIESRPSAEERHRERRWIYEWRASRSDDPAAIFAAWAAAEEEYGDPQAAIAVYQRLADLDPKRTDALDALCRLKLDAGDYEGVLEPLRALRELHDETGRRGISLGIARILLDELGRPVEAASVLAPLLAIAPPLVGAQEMARRLVGDAAAQDAVLERFEQCANELEPLAALRILVFLTQCRKETRGLEQRTRWLARIVELAPADPAAALPALVQGAEDQADALPVWDAAERIARELGKTELVTLAYYGVLVEGDAAPPLAEAIGRRLVALEGEYPGESSRLIDALQRVLELAPEARWALDRVKLVLGSQGRWEELFPLYDRAIGAARTDRERGELLEEAAFAAKDLAVDRRRAIRYLELGHALRPDDAGVHTALERLYEREGQTKELIDLLGERLDSSSGFQLRQLRRRIADLWLCRGSAKDAIAVIDGGEGTRDDASVADVADVLERIAASVEPGGNATDPGERAAAERAIALLREHYQHAGRTKDVVRLAEARLSLAEDDGQRARLLGELVDLCLVEARETPGVGAFACVFDRAAAYADGKPALAKVAYRRLFVRALQAWRHASPNDAADAAAGAFAAVDRLEGLFVDAGDLRGAARLLHRASRLPFEPNRRRELLREAALVASSRDEDRDRAIAFFGQLFDADAGDSIAARSLDRFAELLEAAGARGRLASLLEEQGRLRADAGSTRESSVFWDRAARLWEGEGARGRAIAAYRESAELGSEDAFEALARIHEAAEEWADAAKARRWLYAHASGAARGPGALRLAEAYEALGDRESARACLEDAFAGDARVVCDRLIALYRRDAVWEPLARILAAEGDRSEDPRAKLAMLREAAELRRERLADPAEAAALLEAAIRVAPDDGTLRPALADVLESLERWADTAAVLKDQLDRYGDLRSRERALTHQRRARALGRNGRAHEALTDLRLAADMVPSEPTILHDLARVALDLGELELAESTYRVLLLALHHPAPDVAAQLPDRARVFLDLAEIASRREDAIRAADLVDSAFDAAAERGDDPTPLEEALAARGRYDALARALERRVARAPTLTARATALGHLVSVWNERLARSADLGPRILGYTEAIGRDIDREDLTDAGAWTALSLVHATLGVEAARLGGRDRLAHLLDAAIAKTGAGAQRQGLRLTLGKMLLQEPARAGAALLVLSAARDDDPASVEVAELLADALEREGRFQDLVGLLEEQRRASPAPRGADLVRTTWRLGCALERAGRTKDALAAFEAVLDHEPIGPDVLAPLADRLDAVDSARFGECLERWIAVDPGKAPVLATRLLGVRDRQGDREGAARALEVAFAADPQNAVWRERLVDIYGSLKRGADAVRILRRALELDPSDRALFRRTIEACRADGQPQEGIRLIDAAMAAIRQPTAQNLELFALRAGLREAAGDDEGACADLERAFAGDAAYAPALIDLLARVIARTTLARKDAHAIRLVDLVLEAGQPERAKQELNRLLERSPNHAPGWRRRAILAAAEENWNAAAAAHRARIRGLSPNEHEERLAAVAALVDACERAGCPEDAREEVEQALAARPDNPELLRQLERICEVTGDSTRLADLVAQRGDHEALAADKVRLWLRAAGLWLEANAPANALALLERTQAADPDNLDTVLLRASAEVALGRPSDALHALQHAVDLCHGKRTPQLARVYLEIGKAHLAADELFEAALALDYACGVDRRNDEAAMLLGLVAIDIDDEKTAERALSAITTMPVRKDAAGVGPDSATKAIAFYYLASLAYSKGDVGKARRLASKAVSGDPELGAARTLLDRLDDGTAAAM